MRAVAATELMEANAEVYDCWNRIGVRGDKSCPELACHSHCRNCPAYSAAAMMLLDRDLAGLPAAAATSPLAELARAGEGRTESVVVFRVGAEWFALPTLLLDEIVGMRTVHSLPHRRNPALLGLVNVRGELVVCVAISRLLIGEAATPPQGRLVVIRHTNGRLAFPVDEVQHAHRYRPDELKPVPATIARSASAFTKGLLSWRDRTVGCLDERLVLDALNRSLT
jgi:chemotaxis signal transduction protein